jgi:hypothetical protein
MLVEEFITRIDKIRQMGCINDALYWRSFINGHYYLCKDAIEQINLQPKRGGGESVDERLKFCIEDAERFNRRECFADSEAGMYASIALSNLLEALTLLRQSYKEETP